MLQGKELRDTCLGSATAGVVSKFLCHPIDTAKARLQVAEGASFRGASHVLRATIANEGIRGLYRGIGAVMVGGIPGVSLYLTTYEISKDELTRISIGGAGQRARRAATEGSNFLAHFTAGMLAEIVCCVVFVPVDVVKERLQVQHTRDDVVRGRSGEQSPLYRGSMDALRTILRTEGLGGIYKGYAATIASFGPFSALYFMFYEQTKAASLRLLHERRASALQGEWAEKGAPGHEGIAQDEQGELPTAITLANAAAAAAAAAWITNPLDMAKLRLQVQRGALARSTLSAAPVTAADLGALPGGTGPAPYRGMADALAHIFREGGVAGLFRGSGARMAYQAPSTAIAMAMFEKARTAWSSLLQ